MRAIFLDIETTGLDPTKHRAIDVACQIIDIPSNQLKGIYQSLIQISKEDWEKTDPSSIKVNGYTWGLISKGKPIQEVRDEIIILFESLLIKRGEAVFICQNPSFDRGFFSQIIDVYTQESLNWPYHWLDLASMYWTMLHVKNRETLKDIKEGNLSKNAIAASCGLPPETEPHRAINGVTHLMQCYQSVLDTKFD
ncbi:MAG: 3'-5' exonuclease [Parachlamydiaceae bacterium]|nr:3'-5' exonuclease [Parachlamydiaceae bacterium]